VWSEYCYLLCIAVALLLVVIPPDWNFPGRRVVRQLPLLATMPIAILSVVGQRLSAAPTQHRRAWASALTALLPLLLLGLWIVAGSIHARVVEDWQATFLNLGIYVFAAAAAALMVTSSNAPTQLAQAFVHLIACAAIVMAAGLVVAFGSRDIYHEQIFLAIPIAVTCALTQHSRARAWLGTAFFLGISLLSMKNTSYIIALLSLLYIAALLWLNGIQRAPSLKQLWLNYLAFLGVVAITAVACFFIYFREHYLPSGNVQFRTFTYRAAWQQFLDSPFWGTSFSAESIRKFTLYTVGISRNKLPTHSDVMDLLANGGLLAITLWLVGYLRVFVFAYRRVLAPRFLHYPWAAHAHTFAIISLAAIATYAFNPILLQPELAFLVWTTLGFLAGLAASCDPEKSAGEIARRFHTASPCPARSPGQSKDAFASNRAANNTHGTTQTTLGFTS
jgi:O-antigen ligase